MNLRVLTPLLITLCLSGCVATREDVAGLETQVERLEKSQAELSSQLDGIKAPVMSLNSNLGDTQNLLANFTPRFEEIRAQLEGLKKDLSQKVADLTVKLAALNGQIADMDDNFQAKLTEIKKSQAAAPKAKIPVKAAAKDTKKKPENPDTKDSDDSGASSSDSSGSTSLTTGESSLAVFQNAYKDYTAKRWELAEEGFNAYLAKEPTGSLGDKSLYYAALASKASGSKLKALDYLEKVITQHSKSPVSRTAMLEKARIYLEEGKNGEAEGLLEYLAMTYPKSQEAAEAQELLKKVPH